MTTELGATFKSSSRLFVYDKQNKLQFLVDTGAVVSVVPVNKFKFLSRQSETVLSAANGSTIKTFGLILLNLDLGLFKCYSFPFLLADINTPIIGANFLEHFEISVNLRKKQLIDTNTNKFITGTTGQYRKTTKL